VADDYEIIARYYDLSHDRLAGDVPWLLRLAAESGGPVLEMGCGSGRLLLPLARAGHTVVGLDRSAAMLARAAARLAAEPEETRQRVRLVAGDFNSPFGDSTTPDSPSGEPFGLILFGYNTIMHLDEPAAMATLRRLRPLLRPSGRLWIDVANPLTLAEATDDPDFALEDTLRDGATGQTIRQYTAYTAAPGEQAVDVSWIYETDGGEASRAQAGLRYYYLYPHQYELLLARAGYQLAALYGDYDGSPFDEDSERLILIAGAA
jgi:SAM-dependent methyltransferase